MELVLDASCIIKWFLPEPLSEKALEYRRQHLDGKINLAAPTLLVFEVVNALCTKPKVKTETVVSALEAFYFTQLNEYPLTEKLAKQTAQFAKNFHISAYDAAYLSLAQNLDCQFITADKKLYQKVKSLKFVQLLD